MEPANEGQQPPRSRMQWLAALIVFVAAMSYVMMFARQDKSPPPASVETVYESVVVQDSADAKAPPEAENESASGELTTSNASTLVDDAGSANEGVAPVAAEEGTVADDDEDAKLSKQMIGTWEDDYKGHRILTLLEDGSGKMVVELDGFAATLFAAKLTFTEEWSVKDGQVTMKATGGEPAGKVKLVLNLHGDSSTQKIIEVTDDRMILVEQPSGTRFEWRRVVDPEAN